MAWLPGWSKRYKITIDSSKIDEDLVDYPVLITLASGVGMNGFDARDIFEEITPMSSGTLFADDFTASGINWTSLYGTAPTYSTGTLYLSSTVASAAATTNSIEFGENYEITFKIRIDTRGQTYSYYTFFVCYDNATTNYQMAFEMLVYSSSGGPSYNYFRIYKKNGAASDTVYTDTNNYLYNYYTEYQNWFWVKARRDGDRLRVKWWKSTQSEHPGWLVDLGNVFTPYFPTNGRLRLQIPGGGIATTVQVDDISVKTFTPGGEKKLAITTSDGVTQCPVEIEYWDRYFNANYYYTNSPYLAYLWTKLPLVSSGTNTVFYLYYDKDKVENINYVGNTDSTPAENVWDSDHIFVGHMSTHPNRGVLRDSTSYNIDSTSFGIEYNTHYLNLPRTRYAFNNLEMDKIDLGYSDSNPLTTHSGALTVEAVVRVYSGHSSNGRGIISRGTDYSASQQAWNLYVRGTGPFSFRSDLSDTGSHNSSYGCYSPYSYDLATWYYVVLKYEPGIRSSIFVNSNLAVSNTSTPSGLYVNPGTKNSNDGTWIGATYRFDTIQNYFDGEIAEIRVSKVARSSAWIKANYYNMWDNLLSYEQEYAPRYYYQGYVKEKGLPAQRTVRLYLREDGRLIDETVSASGTGYYYLTTSVSGEHFIVAFDDDEGEEYNALILDRLPPTGIE